MILEYIGYSSINSRVTNKGFFDDKRHWDNFIIISRNSFAWSRTVEFQPIIGGIEDYKECFDEKKKKIDTFLVTRKVFHSQIFLDFIVDDGTKAEQTPTHKIGVI